MASTYPTTLDTFSTTHANDVGEAISAATVNDLASGVNKIEAELGTLPKGGYTNVRARLVGAESRWIPILSVSGFIPAGTASGDLLPPGSAPLPLTTTSSGAEFLHWANSEFAMTGLTTRWSLRASILTNATAVGVDLTFGMLSISSSGGASGQNTVGNGGTTGDDVTFAAPAASARLASVSSEITAPADGWYAPFLGTTGTTATGSRVMFHLALRARNT